MPCLALQRIVLCHNNIYTLSGPLLRGLPALRVLLLDHNNLVELPEEVSWLARLEKLSLAHNKLTDLPAGLASCERLTCILVGHNRWVQVGMCPLQSWRVPGQGCTLCSLSGAGAPVSSGQAWCVCRMLCTMWVLGLPVRMPAKTWYRGF